MWRRNQCKSKMYVGVDGCSDGWIAVRYDKEGYRGATRFGSIGELWGKWSPAETILIDVPIGLRETSNEPRPCDTAARQRLSPTRHSSVFPTPVREAVHTDTYEEAKAIQERETDGSLGTQSWGIAGKISELDTFLRETQPAAKATIHESHPEVCFWVLAGERAMDYSKTGQPAAAFWERVATLEDVDQDILTHVRDAGTNLNAKVENDDIIDAFALALTASPLTGELRSLPEDAKSTDPTGLPMEMVYASGTD